jgi:hypothetical protein
MMSKLKSLSEEQLHVQPNGKWSIIQNINHLILSEVGTLMYLKKKSQGIDTLKKSGFANWIAYQLVYFYTLLPIKIKAPKGLDSPSNTESLAAVDANWEKTRASWKEFISQMTDSQLEIAIFKHPLLSSRLNVYQTIGFCEAHFERHKKQINKIIS